MSKKKGSLSCSFKSLISITITNYCTNLFTYISFFLCLVFSFRQVVKFLYTISEPWAVVQHLQKQLDINISYDWLLYMESICTENSQGFQTLRGRMALLVISWKTLTSETFGAFTNKIYLTKTKTVKLLIFKNELSMSDNNYECFCKLYHVFPLFTLMQNEIQLNTASQSNHAKFKEISIKTSRNEKGLESFTYYCT